MTVTSQPPADPFAVTSLERLLEVYPLSPAPVALAKESATILPTHASVIASSPFCVISTVGDGGLDQSPRGDRPGFVTVRDDRTLVVPDRRGNNRLDTLRNVVATGHAGVIFLIPGRDQTLRVNGAACITADPAVLDRVTPVGKPPRSAIVVRADEVFAHCPKAFVRSRLWNPDSWPAADEQPSPAEVSHAHMRDPALTVADVERQQEESLKHRLA